MRGGFLADRVIFGELLQTYEIDDTSHLLHPGRRSHMLAAHQAGSFEGDAQ